MRSAREILVALAIVAMSLVVGTVNVAAQGFCFDAAGSFVAGDEPHSVAAADLDGDGDVDLAVAIAEGGRRVSILNNNGDGTFAPAVDYTVGHSPISVCAADLDGDRDQDLAVADYGGSVAVLKNHGDGTFAAATYHASRHSTHSVCTADLDGDGDADLAAANYSTDSVSVFKNDGHGTFTAAVYYAAADAPWSIFAADLDGDDDADLAVACYMSDGVAVLENNGDGTFAPAVNYAAGDFPYSVVAVDLDGDHDLDLAVANWNSTRVSVLKNNGDGTFAAALSFPAGGIPYSIAAADLDGDDDPDLAVACYLGDSVAVLGNNGDGTFAAAVSYAVNDAPNSVVAADLDGDNALDLAVTNRYSGNVTVLMNCAPQPPWQREVDILPGQCPNYASLSEAQSIDRPCGAGAVPGGRLLPVALLGSWRFDVHQVGLSSIDMAGLHPVMHEYEDVVGPGVPDESGDCECGTSGGDGYTDLVLMFDLDSVLSRLSPCSPGETRVLELTAQTLKGREFVGRDCVNLTGKITGGGGAFPIVASPTRRTRMQRLSPNPFNAATGITYTLGESENVCLEVYDVLGRRVRTLVADVQSPGEHEVVWDGTDDRGQAVSSGVYFCRLQTESSVDVRQMVLLK